MTQQQYPKLYKFTADGGRSPYVDDYRYSLPTKNEDGSWTPGDWMPAVGGELELCGNGYHACKPEQLLEWCANPELYAVEVRGDIVEGDDKICARQMRLTRRVDGWNGRTARLFAVWCARQALALVDNPDPRSVNACEVAERYANGQATDEELTAAWAAAWDAAWAAAGDAAWDAAWAAAKCSQSKKLLEMVGEK
jgi:hypothetical protein